MTAASFRAARGEGPVAIADSKLLYKPGQGLRLLERGLFAAWSLLGRVPCTCGEAWDLLAGDCRAARHAALCGGSDAAPLPRDADPPERQRLGPPLAAACAAAGVRLIALCSRAVFPAEFNDTVEQCGSKGLALSRWTLDLAARAIAPLGEGRIDVVCDKHGGRNRYVPLLMEAFPDVLVENHGEGRQQSVYCFGPSPRRVRFCFQAKGESHLPTALASMASKYLRELAMHAFCGYWAQHVPGLRPTAGYPADAPRFKRDIESAQKVLGVEDRILWRKKWGLKIANCKLQIEN